MASPIRWFRAHSHVFIVVFGVILMVIFGLGTILSSLDPSSFSSRNRVKDEVVAEWSGGQIKQSDLFDLRTRHFAAINLIENIYKYAVQQNNNQSFPINADGIPAIVRPNENPSSQEMDARILRRFLYAKKAEQEGLIVDDAMVMEYLAQFAGDAGINRNILKQLNNKVNRGVPLPLVIRQLQMELLWQQMEFMARGGLPFDTNNQLSANAINPTEAFELYVRTKREISCQVLPVSVEDYLGKVEGSPTESELKELFQQGQYEYPAYDLSRPGFKQHRKATVQYFIGELETFLQNEMAKLTDEDVQREYEQLLQDNDSLVTELVPQVTPGESSDVDDKTLRQPDSMLEDDPAPAPTDTSMPDSDIPLDEPPSYEPSQSEPSQSGNDNEPEDADGLEGGRYTSYQPLTNRWQDDDSLDESEEPSGNAPDQELEVPQFEQLLLDDAGQRPSSDPELSDQSNSAMENEHDSTEQPLLFDETDDTDAPDDPVIEDQPETQRRPRALKDVADQIKRKMKSQDAREARDKAIAAAQDELRSFHIAYNKWEYEQELGMGKSDPPTIPDFQAIGDKYGLQFLQSKSIDITQIDKEPIGQVVWLDFTRGASMVNVGEQIFQEYDKTSLYQPAVTDDFRTSNRVLYWLSEKVDHQVLKFDEAREHVIAFWKRQQAIEMAKQEAQRIADAVNERNKLLSEVYPERATETGSFPWFLSFGRLSYGSPEGVNLPGEEFMTVAFALEPRQAGVAMNEPRDTAYVIQSVTMVESDLAELGKDYLEKNFFLSQQIPQEVMVTKNLYRERSNESWLRSLFESLKLKMIGQ